MATPTKWIETAKRLWPIPQIPNPAYVDDAKTPEVPELVNEFTDEEWAKEGLVQWQNLQINRFANADAKCAVCIPEEKVIRQVSFEKATVINR